MSEKKQNPHFQLELSDGRHGMRMLLYDVKKVSVISAEKAVFQVAGGEVEIVGKRLSVSWFLGRTACTDGKICEVKIHEKES